jgi:tripartite-type tricarboxylate transporter receptor subunit TctC
MLYWLKWTATAIATVAFGSSCFAQGYPSKPINLVVAFSPGGGTDTIARLISEDLGKALGQSVIVENRPGAAGYLAWRYVAAAPPDGYTLLLSENALAINIAMQNAGVSDPDKKFDPIKSFDAISLVATAPMVLVVSNNLKANTLQEFAALSKAQAINFSSSGIGSVSHLAFEVLRSGASIEAAHMPFKGGGDAISAVAGDHAQANMAAISVGKKMVDGGQLKAMVVTGTQRSPVLPNVPTVGDSGVKTADVELRFWYGLFGPAGMPDDVKQKIGAAVAEALKDPKLQGRLKALDVTAAPSSGPEMKSKLEAEIVNWTTFMKQAKLKLQ